MKTPKWFLKKSMVACLLLPFSVMYYIISKIVYYCRRLNQKKSKRPVICVGNIFAGGVGKTPIVREIAKYLKSPVIMRGYKKNSDTDNLGDEAKMLRQADIDVYVGDRVRNTELLNNQKSVSPIVMDDGFQNPTIKKDISILVFDEKLGYGNGFILPAGPLRESKLAIKRADAVIIIKSKKRNLGFKISCDVPIFYAENRTVVPRGRVVAFAGIGYPQKFFDTISAVGVKSFPDHYQYTASDIDKLFTWAKQEKASLVTTEKDWVRLPADVQKKIKFVPLETEIEPAFWDWLKGKLNEIV